MINNKYIYLSILIISSILNSQERTNLKDYFSESSGRIFSNNSNQIILGTAALAALSSTRVDQKIKVYAQDKGLLPEKVSHLITSMLSLGAVLIDGDGARVQLCAE